MTDEMRNNLKGNGLHLIEILLQNFLGGAEENYEKFPSRYVCASRDSNGEPSE
jgi:hypothetical protein